MKIQNKIAVITGANRGIGYALAEEMATRGAHLHLLMRQPQEFKDQDLFVQKGAKSVEVHEVDIGNFADLESWSKSFLAGTSPDILINNAGQLTGGLLEEQDPQKIISMLNVNLLGVILLTRLFLPHFLQKGSGKIVNNASVSGKMYLPCASTYSASKAGVVAFTECIKQELRETGVSTLLMVTPGVKTRMYDDIPKMYGKNFELDFLTAIPAADWAKKVCDAIESDLDTVNPSGLSGLGVTVAQHSPGLFEKLVRKKFHRDGEHGI